ncbi:hypothetical protein D0A34_23605 [Microcoleus vaginatus PCC 9802]|uniref:hypothetical protein n=1 Tax=Microcoleus vaginatus TaxID=119532 RepID=UPI00020D10AB|nr:hypothetical protein MicvaDRAFT_1764 [Microcoleus vaginatus FGP-2]UNU21432.1 hypothetical protein D0A34_23605 [Microcoleus vaginatus PCC 9802]
MPRNSRRFTKKTLTAAEVDIYASYLKGERIHSQPRKAPAVYKERRAVGIVPFGLSPAATANFVRTSMTRGALGILGTLGITNLDGIFGLNLTNTPTVTDAPAGFYPAIARVTLIPTNAAVNTAGTSAFTGRPRNYKGGRSGSIPFGRGSSTVQTDAKDPASTQTTIADIDYKDAENAIKLAVGTPTYAGKKRLSFEPELYRSERSQPGFTGDAVAPAF